MSDYNFKNIEKKWQKYWKDNNIFKTEIDLSKPKYYILDMFPYPSGSGLHVGHPLGYISSCILSRYKRLKGFNVLHPMGYDAFGLPAEQYAIQTGQHPAVTTAKNIAIFRQQFENIGLCYDWSREVKTCDPDYYKWTQWIFIKMFNSWYNKKTDRAHPLEELVTLFEKEGNLQVQPVCSDEELKFTAQEWKKYTETERQKVLFNYRLAYQTEAYVNWCPKLGTILANEEVKDGVSERGGYPVERKKMNQWFLRITAYVERLLKDLDTLDWSGAVKEMQRNWIGKSEGVSINFPIENNSKTLEVFTTRPDTIFGSTFIVIAPEHTLVKELTSPGYSDEVMTYLNAVKSRSERERMADVKLITGQFTGAYSLNPFTKTKIPIWISDYVLVNYGTGAIMAVPAHDSRDFAFAKHFELPIKEVVLGGNIETSAYEEKKGVLHNSEFLDGLSVKVAIDKMIDVIEVRGLGKRKINYKLRDAGFSRQRYWGEPFPVYYKDGYPYLMDEKDLPLLLPDIKTYKPTGTGEGPLMHAKKWIQLPDGCKRDSDTMPGWAGSNWYFLRYMDPHNPNEFVSGIAEKYWSNVDLYLGGTEHATGHLLYSRFCYKFLFDIGLVSHSEPFKKLINQGMIQGRSNLVYRKKGTNTFVSYYLRKNYKVTPLHVDVNIVENDILDLEKFRNWNPEYKNADFILEDGKYYCGVEIEKMSKSRFNVVNPDQIIEKYGTDTFRMYEMFLGPLEQNKPWNTHGIEGVSKFLKKLWKLFYDESGEWKICAEKPTLNELKILHRTIKKIEEDIERYSFNTCISTFMICVNDLTDLSCCKKEIVKDLLIILSPFAPHICEELWLSLGFSFSISQAQFPPYNPTYLEEDSFEYPISVNGKVRSKMTLALDLGQEEIEKRVLESPDITKWLNGNKAKKVVFVRGRIVNVVI